MPNIRLPAFVGGELSPKLWGRTDLDRYITSTARMENFIPIAEGGADKRHGTDFVAEARYPARAVRLIPFQFNEQQSYILEMGHEYLRVIARDTTGEVSGYVVGPTEGVTDSTRSSGTPPHRTKLDLLATQDDEDLPWNGNWVDVWDLVDMPELVGLYKAFLRPSPTRQFNSVAVQSARWYAGSGLYSLRVFTQTAHGLNSGDIVSFSSIVSRLWPGTGPIESINGDWFKVTAVESPTVFYIDHDVGASVGVAGTDDVLQDGDDDTDGYDVPPDDTKVAPSGSFAGDIERPDQDAFDVEVDSSSWPKDGYSGSWRHFAQIDTPWGEDDVWGLNFDQSADVMTLVHPDYAPRELKRYGHAQWEIDRVWFYPRMRGPAVVIASDIDGGPGTWTATSGTDELWPGGYGRVPLQYQVTAVSDDTGEESIGTYVFYPGTGGNYMTRAEWKTSKCRLTWETVPGASHYNVYKRDIYGGRDYGYIGTVEQGLLGTEDFEDRHVGDTSDVPILPTVGDRPPPRTARNPFGYFDLTYTLPRAVAIFQQRRFFAGTDDQPQGIWSSQSAAYNNFNTNSPTQASDAITAIIAAQQIEPIMHLVKLRKLIIMTSGGEWYVEGDEVGTLTPAAFEPIPQTSHGTSRLRPLLIGGTVLYVESTQDRVRDMSYEYTTDSYQGSELTVMARHLFDDNNLVDWTYAKSPNSLLYAVRDDGVMLTLTYLKEHKVWAWARTTMKTAVAKSWIESSCAITEGEETGVYVSVMRYIGETATGDTETKEGMEFVRYIERFRVSESTGPWRSDAHHRRFARSRMDCAITLEANGYWVSNIHAGHASRDPLVAELGLRTDLLTTGDTVYVELAHGMGADAVEGYWTCEVAVSSASDFSGRLILHKQGTNPDPVSGLYSSETALKWSELTEYVSYAHQNVSGPGAYHIVREMLTTTIGGALDDGHGEVDHLEGETVVIVGDGQRLDDQVVTAGVITLSSECWKVFIGLGYDGIIETLPLHDMRGSLAGRQFSVPKVTVESYAARGYEVGPIDADDDQFQTYPARSEGYLETADEVTDEREITLEPGWGKRGRLTIRHRDPLPCSILSITPKVVTEDDR